MILIRDPITIASESCIVISETAVAGHRRAGKSVDFWGAYARSAWEICMRMKLSTRNVRSRLALVHSESAYMENFFKVIFFSFSQPDFFIFALKNILLKIKCYYMHTASYRKGCQTLKCN